MTRTSPEKDGPVRVRHPAIPRGETAKEKRGRMYNSNCVRCRNARTAGYDGCAVHNIGRRRYTAPTVVVVDNHRHTSPVVVVEDCSPAVGVDVATGDAVLNLGGGLGVDMRTGDLEVNLGGGAYVDVDRGSSWDSGPVDTGGSSDW